MVNTNFPTEWITYVRSAPESLPKIVVYLTVILDLSLLSELWMKLNILRYRKKLIKMLNSAKTLEEWMEMAEQMMYGIDMRDYLEVQEVISLYSAKAKEGSDIFDKRVEEVNGK